MIGLRSNLDVVNTKTATSRDQSQTRPSMKKSAIIVPSRKVEGASRNAMLFFIMALCILAIDVVIFLLCARLFGRQPIRDHFVFPKVFLITSLLLAAGSWSMHKAKGFVKVEKQKLFRSYLVITLSVGAAFAGLQTFGLWSMIPTDRTTDDAVLGVTAFVVALSTLHAIHFCVAELFLVYITIRTWADRYDHEYYWGVTVCTWLWHFLGIVWLAILGVIAIVL